MIIVLNGYYADSSLIPVKSGDMQDDLLDIVIVYEAGFSLLMKYLTQKEAFEDLVREEEIKHIQAKEIIIETKKTKKTKKTMKIDTYGELYLETPVNIDVVSKKLEFIIG